MLADKIDYRTYRDGRFKQIFPVRAFGLLQVLTAVFGTTPVILVVNDERQSATLCLYESQEERDRDVAWVKGLPPDGAAGAGTPAWLDPAPPTLTAGAARPLPEPVPPLDDAFTFPRML